MNKIKKLQTILNKEKIKYAILLNLKWDKPCSNFFYHAGFSGYGILVVGKNKKAELYVPEMEYEKAKATVNKGINVVKCKNSMIQELKKKCKLRKNMLVGVDETALTHAGYKRLRKEIGCKLKDISKYVLIERSVKTRQETSKIRKACKIADDVFHKMFWNFKRFKTESDVEAFMVSEALKQGCEVAFKPIIASGAGGSQPHYIAQKRKLRKGFCVVDFGVRFKGYNSDMTRTIYVGTPTRKEIEHYYLVLEVQKKAIERCKVGFKFSEIDKMARKDMGKDAKWFNHGIGHGLGLDVHELPAVKVKQKREKGFSDELEENMILTIEPGVYIPEKYGIRIEDDILVTRDGPKVLTKTGKNLLIIRRKKINNHLTER